MSFSADNMYCGMIRRGDIFLYEKEHGKEQSVVILQDNVLNEGLPTIVVAPIEPCRVGERAFANEVVLDKKESSLGTEGMCLLHKIMTVDRGRMVAKKGEISPERLQEMYRALDITLGRFRDTKDKALRL